MAYNSLDEKETVGFSLEKASQEPQTDYFSSNVLKN